eukprot:1139847-Pelagomonas_calceolata.AAC.4
MLLFRAVFLETRFAELTRRLRQMLQGTSMDMDKQAQGNFAEDQGWGWKSCQQLTPFKTHLTNPMGP